MTKLNRIKFTKELKRQGITLKVGQEWELMMEQTKENNNHIFVRVGKKGKALNPYTPGNMIGLNNNNLKELINKEAIELT